LASKSNEILTAVVAGMREQEQNLAIKLAATQALSNALEFVNRNFEVDAERDYIMTVICEACTFQGSPTETIKVLEVKEAAFMCLGRIAELYYEKLPNYISAVLEMTLAAISTQPDEVARAAIGFWHEVCDVEYEMLEDEDQQCHKFVNGAAQYLIPVLLRCMSQQEDGQDEDSFNKSTEATSCLAAVSTVVRDDVIAHVVPFCKTNVEQSDWRLREASIMAFGSIMEGPDGQKLRPLVQEMMNYLLKYLEDSEDLVKNSAAWSISRVCEFAPQAIAEGIPQLCQQFIVSIPKSEAGTAEKLCWAIHHLSGHVMDISQSDQPNHLSAQFPQLVKLLIDTGDREDATESSLRATAYEALNALILTADDACVTSFLTPTLLPMLGERLNATFAMQPLNTDDLNTKNEWQAYFCGALQTCITTIVPPEDSQAPNPLIQTDPQGMTVADKFMTLFLQVFSSQNTTAAQEAMLAVGSIVAALPNGSFDRYMQPFGPMLVACLQAVTEPALCVVAISITSDIANQLKLKMTQYSDQIVEVLLSVLQRPDVDSQIKQVHDYIKPGIFSCLGDVAMAIGAGMDKYLQHWFMALQVGCQMCMQMLAELSAEDGYDEDKRYYLSALMDGVLDGYVGIVQGLKEASQSHPDAHKAFLQPVALAEGSLMLLKTVAQDGDKTPMVLQHAVGLLGDLAETYPEQRALLKAELWGLVQQAEGDAEQETRAYAEWAKKKLNGEK
jgi:importin subunit beta-1